ncbi:MAG TPA: sigma-70 family RNA polymerase sigma factor [Polyangiales bacterium]|nr:sigma-70 family RNA polymerase sigma factor [Polyangiales bacterium]
MRQAACVVVSQPGSPNAELKALLTRLAEGDRSAFAPAFGELWPHVMRLCTSMLKNEADAADAAQQAMERILVRAAEYDPRRPALPWALAIASWECRTLLRKRTRRREVTETAVGDQVAASNPEQQLEEQELARAVHAAMGELSELDRETLLATFWEQDPAVSGMTLRKRRERALQRLRTLWKRLYGLD